MATCRCECGAKYRVPDSAIGKRSKCKKCGIVFTLEAEDEGVIPLADEIGLADEVSGAVERERAASPQSDQGRLIMPPGSPAALAAGGPGQAAAAPDISPPRGYWSNVLWSFLFLASPANLVTYLAMWIILSVGAFVRYGGVFALFAFVIIQGWYSAFRFTVLRSAAAGEDEMPSMSTVASSFGDMIEALVAWIGSWIVVLLPSFAYLIYVVSSGTITGMGALEMLSGGLSGMLQGIGKELLVFGVLVCLGLASWPMVVLCVALGGFGTLYRPDLLARTIVKTLPMYALTVALMFGAVVLTGMLAELSTAGTAAPAGPSLSGRIGGAMLGRVLTTAFILYLDIVLMRLVGLYYHHFKTRFVWDWG